MTTLGCQIWTRQSLSSVLDKQEPKRLARKLGDLSYFYRYYVLVNRILKRLQRSYLFTNSISLCRGEVNNDFQDQIKDDLGKS
ncbi:uncharacterized protein METZ01_LOCUS124130 [marine metagenome]|uniref:Uncharacterized protein n=1 Tax=marine metagenome TaxID=408172 RepID=A0A381Y2G7_9ZZZZ